ncbi:hypothetical protein BAU08_13970 [Bordetella bronchialis]|uniref:Uncharacterized protein n=1 Tax=Bordetella bronchialis TaxID=463025 RepID=A0A193FX14_9BORD|nr:hypothetical protein BAU08_13970 [Bordetella bronchialis]
MGFLRGSRPVQAACPEAGVSASHRRRQVRRDARDAGGAGQLELALPAPVRFMRTLHDDGRGRVATGDAAQPAFAQDRQ